MDAARMVGEVMYLFVLQQATDLTHVMSHLAKISFGIAVMIVLVFVVRKVATHASRSGKSKRNYPGGWNGNRRRN